MMGHTHAVTGLAVGAATLPLVPVHGWGQVAWITTAGGMALLPDLDHPDATIADMWGPVTGIVARVVNVFSRGHRNGTHDPVLAPVVSGLLAWGAAGLGTIGQTVVLAIAIGLALRACAFVIPGRAEETALVNAAVSGAGGWWLAVHTAGVPAWMPYAVALGVLAHLAGDAATEGGLPVPLTWIRGEPTRIPGGPITTGSTVERLLIAPSLIVLATWATWTNTNLAHHLEPSVQAIGGVL